MTQAKSDFFLISARLQMWMILYNSWISKKIILNDILETTLSILIFSLYFASENSSKSRTVAILWAWKFGSFCRFEIWINNTAWYHDSTWYHDTSAGIVS